MDHPLHNCTSVLNPILHTPNISLGNCDSRKCIPGTHCVYVATRGVSILLCDFIPYTDVRGFLREALSLVVV